MRYRMRYRTVIARQLAVVAGAELEQRQHQQHLLRRVHHLGVVGGHKRLPDARANKRKTRHAKHKTKPAAAHHMLSGFDSCVPSDSNDTNTLVLTSSNRPPLMYSPG